MSLAKASLNFVKTNDDIAKVNASITKTNADTVKASERSCLIYVNSLRCKQTILNGIEAMGNNIAKAMNAEIQAMSARVDVLNQASLDTIMNKLNASSYAKETSRPHTIDYTTPSKSPSTPNPEPESS
jgi:hypothetical protein